MFREFQDDKVFELLVKNTNEYAAKTRGPDLPKEGFQGRDWSPVRVLEMRRFVAVRGSRCGNL